jgi:hypothetical protein
MSPFFICSGGDENEKKPERTIRNKGKEQLNEESQEDYSSLRYSTRTVLGY